MRWHRSDHPVSRAIARGLEARVGKDFAEAQQLQALPGRGVQAQIGAERWTLANLRWVGEQGWDSAELQAALMLQEQQGAPSPCWPMSRACRRCLPWPTRCAPGQGGRGPTAGAGVKPIVLSGDNSATVRTVAQKQASAMHAAICCPRTSSRP
jgi:Cd2+/Zn2+-exporting ATPase